MVYGMIKETFFQTLQGYPTPRRFTAVCDLRSQRNRNMQRIIVNNRHFPDVSFPVLKLKETYTQGTFDTPNWI
jgi:hypothetical protein